MINSNLSIQLYFFFAGLSILGILLSGYILSEHAELVTNEISEGSLNGNNSLMDTPGQNGILITHLDTNDPIQVLGRFDGYYYIRTGQGKKGWIDIASVLTI